MIETLDDIVEHLADRIGIYGAHRDRAEDCKPQSSYAGTTCRSCWASHMKNRIMDAVEVERKISRRE